MLASIVSESMGQNLRVRSLDHVISWYSAPPARKRVTILIRCSSELPKGEHIRTQPSLSPDEFLDYIRMAIEFLHQHHVVTARPHFKRCFSSLG